VGGVDSRTGRLGTEHVPVPAWVDDRRVDARGYRSTVTVKFFFTIVYVTTCHGVPVKPEFYPSAARNKC
jgi:hypothetical protein